MVLIPAKMTGMTKGSGSGNRREDQPTWQSVTAVGMLTTIVAEQLDYTRSQLSLVEQARPSRPDARVLDDETVAETLRVYGTMADDHRSLFAEQGRRRQAEPTLTPADRAQVDAYVELVAEQLAALDAILTLARQIEGHTIEKVLATSDLELGLQALLDGGHIR
ncbi:MAG: hypothetical protein ACRDRI_26770 [Pseudonocardiaceae bacterium]